MLSSELQKLNITVIDADEVYHSLLVPPSDCLLAIKRTFGDDVLNSDGTLSRPRLASIVFNDKEKLLLLNETVLPFVLDRIRELIARSESELVAVDAPTLIESGFNKECDAVISVICPIEARIERIIKRDGITKEAAMERVSAQKPDSFYTHTSDAVIINDPDEATLRQQIPEILSRLFPSMTIGAKP